jgi:hypothetical protein
MKKFQETPQNNNYHVLTAIEGILKYPIQPGEQLSAYLWRVGRTTPVNSLFPFALENINASLASFQIIGQFLDKPSKKFVEFLGMEPDLTIWLFQDEIIKGGAGLCVVTKGPASGIVPRVNDWLSCMRGKKKKLFITKLEDETIYMAAPLNSFV